MPTVILYALLQSIHGAVLKYESSDEVVGAALTAKIRALLSALRMTVLANNINSKVHAGTELNGRLVRRVIKVCVLI